MTTKRESAAALELSPEQLRRLGYQIVDMLVDHQQSPRNEKAAAMIDWTASESIRNAPFPDEGGPPEQALEYLRREIFPHMMRPDHPRFFAFVPSPSNAVSALAEALIGGFNAFAGAWMEASGPAALELNTVNWLREVCGLPETARGLYVSGGSSANLTALAVARKVKLDDHIPGSVVYFSDQTHSSVERGLRLLGFAPEQIVKLPTDADYRLSLPALAERVAADRAAHRKPFCVIANAGTTNTGAVDPLEELTAYCRREDLWLHADGAYGAAAALCERGRQELRGLGAVDSLSIDPHKWLFQPFEIGCVLVREGELLPKTFRIFPEYLQEVHEKEGVNFCDYGIQLTRGFRALKLWLSLQVFGVRAFREAVERGFKLAEIAEARLRRNVLWEVISPARLAVLCFRYAPAGAGEERCNRLNKLLAEAMFRDGFAAVTTTILRGRTVLRMCTINPRATAADIEGTIGKLEELAAQLA